MVKEFETQNVKYILVANKADLISENSNLISENSRVIRENSRPQFAPIRVSAKLNQHIEVLKEKLVDAVLQGSLQTEDTIITNARHYHALKELAQSLHDIKEGLDNKIPTDLIALDIRRGLHFLGEITGEITNEDQLDYIFSKFCIGK